MKPSDKIEAIQIIAKENSPKVSFHVPKNDNYSNVYDILIHECNVSTTKALIKAGFLLSMGKKGLVVDKY